MNLTEMKRKSITELAKLAHEYNIEGASSMVMRRPDGISFAVLLNSNEPAEKSPPIAVLTVPMQLAANHAFAVK